MRPAGQDDDGVGQGLGLVHVVGGEHHRATLGTQVADHLPRLASGGGVEAGGRLVEEDQLGIADEGESEVESSLLATREDLDPGCGLLLQTDQADDLVDRAGGFVEIGALGQRLGDGQVRARRRTPGARCPPGPATPGPAGPGRTPGHSPRRRRGCGSPRGSRLPWSCRLRSARAWPGPRRGGPPGRSRARAWKCRRTWSAPGPRWRRRTEGMPVNLLGGVDAVHRRSAPRVAISSTASAATSAATASASRSSLPGRFST